MARPLRVEFDGAIYHVTSRGNAREDIFDDDGDRRAFLETLGKVVSRFNWLCHAYCPGVLHHVMARGIARQAIFRDNSDRDDLVVRVGTFASRS